jgi:hypothetical protein
MAPTHEEGDDNPVRRFNGIQDVHAKLVKGPLQRPGAAHEFRDGCLGPVHHHRVGVYPAEGRFGVVPGIDGLCPQRQEPFQESDHGTSLLCHRRPAHPYCTNFRSSALLVWGGGRRK